MRIGKKTKLRLVADWRQSWRWASMRLAALFAVIAGVLSGSPDMLLGLINIMPTGPMRTVISVGVALVMFVIPMLARLVQKCRHEGEVANVG